jgi:site-specific recombinase XerD
MDPEIEKAFEKVGTLISKVDARMVALQAIIERTLTAEQKTSLRRDLKALERIYFRLKAEGVRDLDPSRALRFSREARRLSKSRKDGK